MNEKNEPYEDEYKPHLALFIIGAALFILVATGFEFYLLLQAL